MFLFIKYALYVYFCKVFVGSSKEEALKVMINNG